MRFYCPGTLLFVLLAFIIESVQGKLRLGYSRYRMIVSRKVVNALGIAFIIEEAAFIVFMK